MEIIRTPPLGALQNMEYSWNILNSLKDNPRCILHFYNWNKPAVTHGYFTDPAQFLNLKELEAKDIEIARRPTGGGIIFHLDDLAFAFFLPANHPRYSINTLENYAAVNGAILEALKPEVESLGLLMEEKLPLDQASRHFCMAKPTRYDLMANGFKIAGGAQRRIQGGVLHQGSIHLKAPQQELLQKLLLPGTCVAEAMQKNSAPELLMDSNELKNALIASFTEAFPAR